MTSETSAYYLNRRKDYIMRKEKSAAILTINRPADMSPQGAIEVARWLNKQRLILLNADNRKALAKRYTARYIYIPGKE